MPMPAELRTKIRGNQRATGHRGKGEEAPPSTKENQPLRRDSLRFFPAKMVRNVRAGPRRRRSPELAGRPPAGGGMAVARPPTMADGRIHRPRPSPAYVFSPQIWSEPSERALDEGVRRSSPDGRRRAVARPPTVADGRIHRPWPSPAYVYSPQIWSEPSERALDEGVRRSSPDGRRPAVVPAPTVEAERIHRPCLSPAYIFSRKYGPNRPKRGLAGKVRRTSPDHRRRAVARNFFGPWGWWPIEITAYGLRGL